MKTPIADNIKEGELQERQYHLVGDHDAAAIIARFERSIPKFKSDESGAKAGAVGAMVEIVVHAADLSEANDSHSEWMNLQGEVIAYDPEWDLLLVEAGDDCFAGPSDAICMVA